MRYRTFPGADEDAQATCTEFTSGRLAMGDAQEAGALLASGERRYVASWGGLACRVIPQSRRCWPAGMRRASPFRAWQAAAFRRAAGSDPAVR
jgi:hypothetical protein